MIEPRPVADHGSPSAPSSAPVNHVGGGADARGPGRASIPAETRRQSSWRREVTELRLLVGQLREELRRIQSREKGARYLAFHDDLTSLPNRRYFRERLETALRGEGAGSLDLAVIYLDLDGFKTLNDVHGHDTGDQLLNLVAVRLAYAVRAEDFVSRLGGDEYACLITGVPNRERLQLIAASLFDAVSAPFKLASQVLTVHPSIGIAVYPQDGTTTDALMNSADAAMYAAKRKQSMTAFSPLPAVPVHNVEA